MAIEGGLLILLVLAAASVALACRPRGAAHDVDWGATLSGDGTIRAHVPAVGHDRPRRARRVRDDAPDAPTP
jgi:hypothetical protein